MKYSKDQNTTRQVMFEHLHRCLVAADGQPLGEVLAAVERQAEVTAQVARVAAAYSVNLQQLDLGEALGAAAWLHLDNFDQSVCRVSRRAGQQHLVALVDVGVEGNCPLIAFSRQWSPRDNYIAY